jgi:hypothetical protein|tara:strand:- start:1467 stop:2183 length:717 start_codon:yes stop_codon:yes gene_type:complete
MSKAKYLVAGGKYAGKKIIDLVKSIKKSKRAKKSKAKFEKTYGYKLNQSVKKYQNVASSGSSDKAAIIPAAKQTQRGSSFRVHRVRGTGANSTRGMGSGRQIGSSGSAESWRSDMEKLTNMPSFNDVFRSVFKKKRKALGGIASFKRGGDNMPARNKKNFRPTDKGAGMTRAGVAAYRRANPGSKLKTAVTGKVKPGSKAAKRRKSFCARSAGQMKKFPKAAKDPNSRLRQARRRWKC